MSDRQEIVTREDLEHVMFAYEARIDDLETQLLTLMEIQPVSQHNFNHLWQQFSERTRVHRERIDSLEKDWWITRSNKVDIESLKDHTDQRFWFILVLMAILLVITVVS